MRALRLALLTAACLNGASLTKQVLEWTEAQPWKTDRSADPAALTRDLSSGDRNVEFSRPSGQPDWLELTIRFHVSCGEDTSVYLYSWSGDHWARRFALEPESPLDSVELEASNTLVLVTGWPPACRSGWHPLFVGLYRVDAGQKTLLQGTENANSDGEVTARLEASGMRVEFTGESIDPVLAVRRHVLHYVIDAGVVRRADPVALSAQDFVDEWLRTPWAGIAGWSEAGLASEHDQLPKSGQMGTVERCAGAAGVWQVSVGSGGRTRYFSVLDKGGHAYRMTGIGDTACKTAKR